MTTVVRNEWSSELRNEIRIIMRLTRKLSAVLVQDVQHRAWIHFYLPPIITPDLDDSRPSASLRGVSPIHNWPSLALRSGLDLALSALYSLSKAIIVLFLSIRQLFLGREAHR